MIFGQGFHRVSSCFLLVFLAFLKGELLFSLLVWGYVGVGVQCYVRNRRGSHEGGAAVWTVVAG